MSRYPVQASLWVTRLPLILASIIVFSCLLTGLITTPVRAADGNNQEQSQAARYVAPRWALEFKGGKYKPDLDLYETFYGDDKNTFWAITGAYRFKNWLELGAELGYTNDEGVGVLPNNGILGGQVDYTLMPLQIFLNIRYDASPGQLFVPYAGIGVVTAWYKQKIDLQPERTGRTDIGASARVGVQLQISNSDRRGATYLHGSRRLQTYLFLEGQIFSTEIDDIDLGGEVYLLGLRFEFD
jgi:opacity protein-like surface antigen